MEKKHYPKHGFEVRVATPYRATSSPPGSVRPSIRSIVPLPAPVTVVIASGWVNAKGNGHPKDLAGVRKGHSNSSERKLEGVPG